MQGQKNQIEMTQFSEQYVYFLEISKLSLKFWLETFTLFDKQVIIHSQKSSKILVYEN